VKKQTKNKQKTDLDKNVNGVIFVICFMNYAINKGNGVSYSLCFIHWFVMVFNAAPSWVLMCPWARHFSWRAGCRLAWLTLPLVCQCVY
jgi:hypothetical protein